MTFRFPGLVPAFAILAVGVAHAQSQTNSPNYTGGGGSMAYPQSLPSGQVNIPGSTARDTGSMAYPASPGGVNETAPTGRDTGNMAYPTGRGSIGSKGKTVAQASSASMAAPAMRPDVAPTPAQTAAARNLAMAPSTAPVPYTDFTTPAPMKGKGAMMHKAMPRKAAMKKPAAKAATPAAATPAPATPAPASK